MFKEIIRQNIQSLQPYRCARDDYNQGILLDANENTTGSSIGIKGLERYPDPRQTIFKQLYAKFRNCNENQVFVGVGSDEIIDLLIRICCVPQKDSILICPATYGMYQVCAQINDVQVIKVPLKEYQLDIEQMKPLLNKVKLVFLCSPGNPTGKLLKEEDLLTVCKNCSGLVVVDEAYIDFTLKESMVRYINEYPNLVVMQTLSKSFGLAGIRIGISLSHPEIAAYLNKTKAPYNISSPTNELAIKAMQPDSIQTMKTNINKIIKQRQWICEELIKIGVETMNTNSNFVLARFGSNELAMKIYKKLAEDVVVRFRGNEWECEGCLRITVGNEQENLEMITKMRQVIEQVNK